MSHSARVARSDAGTVWVETLTPDVEQLLDPLTVFEYPHVMLWTFAFFDCAHPELGLRKPDHIKGVAAGLSSAAVAGMEEGGRHTVNMTVRRGDLRRVGRGDSVLILSRSGTPTRLYDLAVFQVAFHVIGRAGESPDVTACMLFPRDPVAFYGPLGRLGPPVFSGLQRAMAVCARMQAQAEMRREIMASVDDRCLTCGIRSRKTLRCGVCRRASYCGPECQRLDWRRHKAPCSATRHPPVSVEAFCRNSGEHGVQKK
jgi:hypothetical protein